MGQAVNPSEPLEASLLIMVSLLFRCVIQAGLGSDKPGGKLVRTLEANLMFPFTRRCLSRIEAGHGSGRPGGKPARTVEGQLDVSAKLTAVCLVTKRASVRTSQAVNPSEPLKAALEVSLLMGRVGLHTVFADIQTSLLVFCTHPQDACTLENGEQDEHGHERPGTNRQRPNQLDHEVG